MITIREAAATDVAAIRDIFQACYALGHPDRRYSDETLLIPLIYSDDTLVLVAEDTETHRVLGTGSVIYEVGAYSDLVGEFGRLAVHPDARNRGIGKMLMVERIRRVRDRLQVGLIEARVSHPYTLKIAEAHGFAVVGYLPLKWMLEQRESLSLMTRYFGDAIALRRNHPRVIPEVAPLAHLALENHGIHPDVIIDEEAPSYPPGTTFDIEEMSTQGYSALLRIQRGRVRHREIFGPVRLHYGPHKLQTRKSRYLIAREDGHIVGGVGFMHDPVEQFIRVIELIASHDNVVRPLLAELERRCREEWDICYAEVDVAADATRMQRTLVELGFLPAAYAPALVFQEVERLDVVKMVRLLVPAEVDLTPLSPRARVIAEVVLRQFRARQVLPRIASAVRGLALFAGLDSEQIDRLAGVCGVTRFAPGEVIFRQGEPGSMLLVPLEGEVNIEVAGQQTPAGVQTGECLGEISMLTGSLHSVTATTRTTVEAATLGHADLVELVRLRPDIALHLYRNLAVELGQKLKRVGTRQ